MGLKLIPKHQKGNYFIYTTPSYLLQDDAGDSSPVVINPPKTSQFLIPFYDAYSTKGKSLSDTVTNPTTTTTTETPTTGQKVSLDALKKAIDMNLNIPYVWGGKSKQGADCSGFVDLVYKDLGIGKIFGGKRTNLDQYQAIEKDQLKPGDVLMLKGTIPGRDLKIRSHVGIFMGYEPDGKIRVAESTGRGSNSRYRTWDINKGYYAQHWLGARRIFSARRGFKL